MEYIHHYDSPLGGITTASDGKALTGLWFDGQKYFADTLEKDHEEKALPVFDEADRWLDIYFSGKEPDFTPPLAAHGTAFREMVWEILLTIPYGQTMSYGEIASIITAGRSQTNAVSGADRSTMSARAAKPRMSARAVKPRMSAQAVGGAVGHNPISLIIPCHRVIGADGSLTGYAGGLERKQALLELEQTGV